MVVRVVLGGGPLGRRFARELATWPGELYVLVDEEVAAERLRDEGIAASQVDTTDAAAIASTVPPPDIVLITGDEMKHRDSRLRVGATAFPDTYRIALSEGDWPEAADRAALHLDVARLQARDIAEAVLPDAFLRSLQLLRTLSTLESPIAIVMHDNPDPDAIAAACGMVKLADTVGKEGTPLYGGEITHQENRAFVNLLELDLKEYDTPEDIEEYGSIVLVDHAHPGINDQLSPTTSVDIIIDHHPAREEADAGFVDRRHDVGATSTLLADHLFRTFIEPDSTLASALWYGIHVDTDGFHRGVSKLDFDRAAWLRQWVDTELLGRIESPQMTAQTLDTIGAAIAHRERYDDILIAGTGQITDRDALSQAADELLLMADVSTVLIYGHMDEMVYASTRSNSDTLDVGDAIRLAFGQIGDAGGHEDMAGAQIPMGMLRHPGTDDVDADIADIIADRFLEGIEVATRPLPSGYHIHEAAID